MNSEKKRPLTEKELSLTLTISGLSVENAEELTHLIYEMQEKDPTRVYLIFVQGLEDQGIEEAKRIFSQIFRRGRAS